jgi:cytoskeletal protein RodZ
MSMKKEKKCALNANVMFMLLTDILNSGNLIMLQILFWQSFVFRQITKIENYCSCNCIYYTYFAKTIL